MYFFYVGFLKTDILLATYSAFVRDYFQSCSGPYWLKRDVNCPILSTSVKKRKKLLDSFVVHRE